jgi:hypothetical protein
MDFTDNSWCEMAETGAVIRHCVDGSIEDPSGMRWLRWCATHQEPLWVWMDGKISCFYDGLYEEADGEHEVVDPPWVR